VCKPGPSRRRSCLIYPEQLIALADIGAFAGLAFADPDRYLGRTVTIAGDELRPPEISAALIKVAGRDIAYVQLPVESMRRQNELPAEAAEFLRAGGYGAYVGATCALHPGLRTFETWLSTAGSTLVGNLFGLDEQQR
jgi:hypothetical protein